MIMTCLSRLDRALAVWCRRIVCGCLLGLFFLLFLGIVQRFLPFIKLTGYDELIELLFGWMTFVGAVALWREGTLYRVAFIDQLLSPRAGALLEALIHAGMLVVALVFAVYGHAFVRMSSEITPFLQIDKAWWYASIPVCGSLMAIYSTIGLWRALRGHRGSFKVSDGALS
ncbi:MAG: TRAP transporter small permease subunit [Burkholderiaceae bacterium]